MHFKILCFSLAILAASTSCRQPSPRPLPSGAQIASVPPQLPGPQPDGSVLLPNQWSLRPAGRQIELRDFPANIAVHPGGRFAAVLHNGYSAHQISMVDLLTEKAISHVNVNQSFYGIEFSGDGKRLFCSGAGDEVIHAFDFNEGHLTNHQQIRLRDIKERGIPSGLAVDAT